MKINHHDKPYNVGTKLAILRLSNFGPIKPVWPANSIDFGRQLMPSPFLKLA
jgi:hypothetical protein